MGQTGAFCFIKIPQDLAAFQNRLAGSFYIEILFYEVCGGRRRASEKGLLKQAKVPWAVGHPDGAGDFTGNDV